MKEHHFNSNTKKACTNFNNKLAEHQDFLIVRSHTRNHKKSPVPLAYMTCSIFILLKLHCFPILQTSKNVPLYKLFLYRKCFRSTFLAILCSFQVNVWKKSSSKFV